MTDREESSDTDEALDESADDVSKDAADEPLTESTDSSPRAKRRAAAAEEDDEDEDDEPAAPAPPKKPTHPGYAFLFGWSAAFLAADLGTKYWAMQSLTDKPKWKIIDGLLAFDLVHNPGGAGGVLGDLPDNVRLPLFFVISAVAVAFIVSLFRKLEPRQVALKWALPLVLGGAFGNLVDRIRYQRVVDFIEVTRHWPTFNVADIWITVGVGLMIVDMFTPKAKKKRRTIRPNAAREEATEKG